MDGMHAICCTGANLEEDVFNLVAHDHYEPGSPLDKIKAANARNLVIAQIEHQETDPLPYTLDFEGDVAERLDAYYGSAAWRDLLRNHPHDSICGCSTE